MPVVCSWPVRWDVHYVEQTGSTNADLRALARGGAPAGTVVRAGHQTAGRGRLDRTWEAPPGSSLLTSILLPVEAEPFLAVARVALATADACGDLAGVDAALKWPNDLTVGDGKLAGLLAEADAGSPTVVFGLGCNVTWPAPDERPPALEGRLVALSDLTATPPGSADLLAGVLRRLDTWMLAPAGRVLDDYRDRCGTLGRRVRVELADGAFEGTAAGITPSGELIVDVGIGRRLVRTGDVIHLRTRPRPEPGTEVPLRSP
ncbi:MAG: biotin--[acetyl-CoA-carboxylase] ligase [Acidimicrobiales bacterium]